MKLTCKGFRAIIYYDFRRGLSQQECIDQLIQVLVTKHYLNPLYVTGLVNLVVSIVRLRVNLKKII